ncbi:hypothetical protein [Rufibacter roseus]|uniref:Lipoprotein n=1 Tax=Rufibacter roseus TaxID=1567108 RepID=A0ABW2DG50_9BACT|nr:hypothetical protein [Rufibacter roseus]
MSRSIFSILFLGFSLGCSRPELVSSEEQEAMALSSPTQATLALQQPTQVGSLRVRLQKIDDSRCPMNAMCIRYGSAVADFQIEDSQGNSAAKRLYLGDALPAPDNRGSRTADTVEVALGNRHYFLILSDVQPYPNTSDSIPPEKKVTVSVLSL